MKFSKMTTSEQYLKQEQHRRRELSRKAAEKHKKAAEEAVEEVEIQPQHKVEIFDYEMPEGAVNVDSDADSDKKDDVYKALDIDLSEAIKEPPKKVEVEKPKNPPKEVLEEKTKSKKKSKKTKDKKDKKKKKKVKENGNVPELVEEPVAEAVVKKVEEPKIVEPEPQIVVEKTIETPVNMNGDVKV